MLLFKGQCCPNQWIFNSEELQILISGYKEGGVGVFLLLTTAQYFGTVVFFFPWSGGVKLQVYPEEVYNLEQVKG